MATLDSLKTIKNLKKKGFVANNRADRVLEFWHNGKYILHTKVSHGSKHDIDESLIHMMSIQCMLPKKSFLDLANCPMGIKEYLEILKEKDVLK